MALVPPCFTSGVQDDEDEVSWFGLEMVSAVSTMFSGSLSGKRCREPFQWKCNVSVSCDLNDFAMAV